MNAPVPQDQLIDPRLLAEAGEWELLSRRVVDGLLSGRHRSTHRGGMVEFVEYRNYSPGDEVRLIDWRVFGRSDRYCVRRFEEETNLRAVLLVDASGSMGFGLSTPPKLRYAHAATACLARLILRQRDSVGLAVCSGGGTRFVPPRGHASHLQAIFAELTGGPAEGPVDLGTPLREVADRFPRRGLFVILSDLLGQRRSLGPMLAHLRARGHDAIVFHVLAPEELTFAFDEWSEFTCLEGSSPAVMLDPPAVRKKYLKRLAEFLNEVEMACRRNGVDYVRLSTRDDLASVLSRYLLMRARRQKR